MKNHFTSTTQATLNNKNIKQENGIELTFTLEARIQNQHFSQEIHQFFSK